jgi:hypothetical protein
MGISIPIHNSTFCLVELFELTMSCTKKQQAIRHAGLDPASVRLGAGAI